MKEIQKDAQDLKEASQVTKTTQVLNDRQQDIIIIIQCFTEINTGDQTNQEYIIILCSFFPFSLPLVSCIGDRGQQNISYSKSARSTLLDQKAVSEAKNQDTRPSGWSDILPYFLPFVVFAFMAYSEFKYGNPFVIVWLAYVVIPICDYLLPVDHKNLSEVQVRAFEKDKRFLIPVYLTWLLDVCIYFSILYFVSIGKIAQTPASFVLYVVSYAQPGAINAVVGHELLHRREKVHKIFGTLAYSKMLYSHFLVQHIVSHHKKVATPEDPSTARMNESLYDFYWRALPDSYVEVWNIEKQRLERENVSPFNPIRNRLLLFNFGHLVWLCIVYQFFGAYTVVFHLAYSLITTMMLEAVNYLEHYGLLRKKDANGNYESVSIKHSFNAPQVVTNLILFKLQRHSDHHAYAYKPYQILDSYPESPMLPYGYSISLVLSFFPYIWKKVHNPIAEATNNDTKISEEVRQDMEKWILGTLIGVSIVLTYITFFVIGFTPRE